MGSPKADLAVLSRSQPRGSEIPPPGTRWKTRVAVPLALLTLFAGLLAYTGRDLIWPAREVRIVPVVVKRAAETSGGTIFQAAGWVEPDPFPIYVTALSSGVVDKVHVLEGQRVKQGQILVSLVARDAQLELSRAKALIQTRAADLSSAAAKKKAALRDWDNPVAHRLAVATATSKLAQTVSLLLELKSQVAVQSARIAELTEQLRRQQKAFKGGGVPEWKLVKLRLALTTQNAILDSIKAKRPTLEATCDERKAAVSAAKQHLELRIQEKQAVEEAEASLARATAAMANAMVVRDEAQLKLARMTLSSPINGIVLTYVRPGSKLQLTGDMKNSALAVELYDPAKLQVRVDVPLAEAARVSVGQLAKVIVEVLPDVTFDGVVTRIVHHADIQKNTLQVKVRIKAPSAKLKPEMLARVKFLSRPTKRGSARERLFMPEKLIEKKGKDGGFVWIVDKGNKRALKRPVTLGITRLAGWIEVTSGLNPGDALISGDRSGLSSGQRVKIVGEAGGDHGAD